MNTKELIEFLKYYNRWRTGEINEPMPQPKDITKAMNHAIDGLMQLEKLKLAALNTIAENPKLAEGKDCILARLKRALRVKR